jgi:phosphoglycerate dehydrogenase-like enzyme
MRTDRNSIPESHRMSHVLIVAPDPEAYASRLRPAFPQVEFATVRTMNAADALEHYAAADAVLAFGRGFTQECLARAKKLKWFQCLITGTDHLTPILAGSDIVLTNARGIHGPQMAEMAILHMMALSRNIVQIMRNQFDRKMERIRPRVLDRRTVVILGVGVIAEHTAKVCKAFGMTTIGVSRTPREVEGFDRMFARAQMLEAVALADYLLVLLPYTAEDDKVVGEAVFNAMKPTAYLVNIARGGVVDEAALVKALDEKRIAGAGLDVFDQHPLPPSSPLWGRPNVFITPFVGGQSDQYEQNVLPIVETNLRCFLAGDYAKMINRVALE